MKQHAVIFSFYANVDAPRIKHFFVASEGLQKIPGVSNFKQWKQVSDKNDYQFGLSMEFNSDEDFQNYNNHPMHAAFIDEQWIPCVAEFLEIDFEALSAEDL